MRAVPVPPGFAEHYMPGSETLVIAGPDGDLTGDVRPVEAIISTAPLADRVVPTISVLWKLEDEDLEAAKNGGLLLLTIWGTALPPHDMQIVPPVA